MFPEPRSSTTPRRALNPTIPCTCSNGSSRRLRRGQAPLVISSRARRPHRCNAPARRHRQVVLMPRRDHLHKLLLIGSGPIVIGQAAEVDYSGPQGCRVLRQEGYEVVLVNSNPATIMTDPEVADRTY